MPRYVDVDAFREKVLKGMRYQHDKQLLINHSYTFQTADVQKVKHAHWIMEQRQGREIVAMMPKTIETWYVCSACSREERKKEPYCNCGAKMDEEEQK